MVVGFKASPPTIRYSRCLNIPGFLDAKKLNKLVVNHKMLIFFDCKKLANFSLDNSVLLVVQTKVPPFSKLPHISKIIVSKQQLVVSATRSPTSNLIKFVSLTKRITPRCSQQTPLGTPVVP